MDGTSLNKLIFVLECIGEKIERFVAAIEKSSKDNDKWMDGRVSIDARTHTTLLEAVQKLSGHFDKWFELQTKTPAQQCVEEISDALTAAVDVQDARKMGEEIRGLLYSIPSDNSPMDYADRVLHEPGCINDILKKYGYGMVEEGAGHDMDRCNKHHAHNCPDCHPLPEDAEER